MSDDDGDGPWGINRLNGALKMSDDGIVANLYALPADLRWSIAWEVGQVAKWLPVPPIPPGSTWNPPPPGWVPPTKEQAAHRERVRRGGHVTIIEVSERGVPTRARFNSDGYEFDPSEDIDNLKLASYEGWERNWDED